MLTQFSRIFDLPEVRKAVLQLFAARELERLNRVCSTWKFLGGELCSFAQEDGRHG